MYLLWIVFFGLLGVVLAYFDVVWCSLVWPASTTAIFIFVTLIVDVFDIIQFPL